MIKHLYVDASPSANILDIRMILSQVTFDLEPSDLATTSI